MPSGHYKRVKTTNMEVTSIRLDAELKRIFKEVTKGTKQGYQDKIREILWQWVQRNYGEYQPEYSRTAIQATFDGVSNKEQVCAFTKMTIVSGEPCKYALMLDGNLVPMKDSTYSE